MSTKSLRHNAEPAPGLPELSLESSGAALGYFYGIEDEASSEPPGGSASDSSQKSSGSKFVILLLSWILVEVFNCMGGERRDLRDGLPPTVFLYFLPFI